MFKRFESKKILFKINVWIIIFLYTNASNASTMRPCSIADRKRVSTTYDGSLLSICYDVWKVTFAVTVMRLVASHRF